MLSFISCYENEVFYNNVIYSINLSYNKVLLALSYLDDDELPSHIKIEKVFDVLVENGNELDIISKNSILTGIFEYINSKPSNNNKSDNSKNKKIIDFHHDAPAIYAAFLQDYNIDLLNQKDRLHWFDFMALLENISDRTKLHQIIGYRTMKIPVANKHNLNEVRRMRELQKLYQLPSSNAEALEFDELNSSMATIFNLFSKNKEVK